MSMVHDGVDALHMGVENRLQGDVVLFYGKQLILSFINNSYIGECEQKERGVKQKSKVEESKIPVI